MYRPVTPEQAQLATPTRDTAAERGVGRAVRQEANLLPQVPVAVTVQRPGMSAIRAAHIGKSVEVRKDLTGRPGALTVAVRTGNADPRAVGLRTTSAWGIAGVGADDPAAQPKSQRNLFLIGGLAALAACFLLLKK